MKREQEVIHSQNNSSSKDFVLGAIIGGVVGAATALFLAPKPGKELLHDLNDHASVLKQKGVELTGSVKDRGNEFISIAKDKTEQLSHAVTQSSVDLKDKVKSTVTNIPSANHSSEEVSEKQNTGISLTNKEMDEIQQKLEETKRAFDETESKYNA
ncbi:YtxH domain-containing protein [Bacillus sp. B1-b2]|uniref:YtxH domain-containing protein n=1 Tax=Bacillus sp. B1-b2 TaxID=2653201 RepID=UPI0012623508|nr:YtxH domain-containing protein [Bacillus sp. B1-b2]KAB7666776.1 YtxH domain-containing protein [Bacillus sp. B1-b2]